jgi:hypothetical protein
MRSSQTQDEYYRFSHLVHIIIIAAFLAYLTELSKVHRRGEQTMAHELHVTRGKRSTIQSLLCK